MVHHVYVFFNFVLLMSLSSNVFIIILLSFVLLMLPMSF